MRPAHLGRIFGMIELLPVMGERQDAGRMDVDVNVDGDVDVDVDEDEDDEEGELESDGDGDDDGDDDSDSDLDGSGGESKYVGRLRLREILFYDDKVAIFKARHGRL